MTRQSPFVLSLSKHLPGAGRACHALRQAQGERWVGAIALPLLLAACAQQAATGVQADAPGFLWGVWHGFIFPVAWIASLFVPEFAVYAVPNNGGWYDFGFFLGVVVLGVGARKSKVVYVTSRSRRA